MTKRLKSIAAAVAVSLVCFPIAACNAVNPVGTDDVESIGSSSASEMPEVALPVADDVTPDPTEPEPEPEPEPVEPELDYVASNDVWSSVYPDAYLWDGDLKKAGWEDTETSKALHPDSYQVNDTAKVISIGNASAFAYFAHQASLAENNGFEGYTVTLERNIDLGGDANLWIPISFFSRADGEQNAPVFKGVFDGNGHKIYNFSSAKFYEGIAYTDGNAVVNIKPGVSVPLPVRGSTEMEYTYGLFGTVGNAAFKNVEMIDVAIDMPTKTFGDKKIMIDAVGAIVGYAAGDLKIENCVVGTEAALADPEIGAKNYIKNVVTAGGLVGRAYAGKKNGAPFGSVKGTDGGAMDDGFELGTVSVKNSKNYLDILLTQEKVTGGYKAGGIVGCTSSVCELSFSDCENYGELAASYVGGIISFAQGVKFITTFGGQNLYYSLAFKNVKNYGDLHAVTPDSTAAYVGGVTGQIINFPHTSIKDTFVGNVDIEFTDCINYGNIDIDKTQTYSTIRVAGIAASVSVNGKNGEFVFENNFNYGNVAGDATASNKNAYTAGLLAYISENYADKSKITVSGGNCGAVTGANKVSGCVASDTSAYTVKYLIDAYKAQD